MPKEDTQFKPGQSGNPGGRPKVDEEFKRIRILTTQELSNIATLMLEGSIDDLKAIQNDPKSSVLRVMLASMAIKGLQGSEKHYNALLDRIVGKPRQAVDVSGSLNLLPQWTPDKARRAAENFIKGKEDGEG